MMEKIKNNLTTIIVFLAAYFLSAFLSYGYFSSNINTETVYPLSLSEKSKNNLAQPTEEEGPKTEPCPLNGRLYSKKQKEKWEKRRPLGIMVENHKEARPQSGLQNADVIYEAVAEGGITRFLAIYLCEDSNPVGPVRSARVYFIRLLQEYGNYPLYGHVGGANTPGPADALGLIKKLGWNIYNDLNQFSVPFPYYWRDYERLKGRATEHTVYTSTEKLWRFAAKRRKLTDVDRKGIRWDEEFRRWKFKEDSTLGKITKISFGFWSTTPTDPYYVEWRFDKNQKTYIRYNGGKPLIDKNTNKPLAFKNIIIIFAREYPANDGYPGGHLLYKLKGENKAIIFYNGKVIKGKWKKKTYSDRMILYDSQGKEVVLTRGKIFVEVLPAGNKVIYE